MRYIERRQNDGILWTPRQAVERKLKGKPLKLKHLVLQNIQQSTKHDKCE